MGEAFKKTAEQELAEMEDHIAQLTKVVEENRSKLNALMQAKDKDIAHHKGVWSQSVEDWRAMLRFFSKS
ncbi:MAG: hypothetical protein JXK94_05335 [Deltaproteobacteria bacterium]|nr:hypothetical protein [Deltaproteobacteria bacterium]